MLRGLIARRAASTLSVTNRIATVSLDNPPVNLLTRDVLSSLKESFDSLPNRDDVDGVILTSSKNGIFTGGLDIVSLHQPSIDELREYWTMVQDMWLSLYMCPLPVVAALNGPSPAAGCLLSLACDYRIKADNPKFITGLNETMLGFAAPSWLAQTYSDAIGKREANLALQLSTLYPPQDAKKIGLVDHVCPLDELPVEAEIILKKFIAIPARGRVATKLMLHEPLANWLRANQTDDADKFIAQVLNPETQHDIGNYLAYLKKR